MNITYLLGAGASANAIPTVENMPQAINNTIGTLKQFNTHNVIQEEGIVKKLVQGAETHTEELKPILEDAQYKSIYIMQSMINSFLQAMGLNCVALRLIHLLGQI